MGVHENQRVKEARQMLIDLGVNEKNIGYDDLRQVGRGVRNSDSSFDQLCGNCANGVLAVSPNGVVWPLNNSFNQKVYGHVSRNVLHVALRHVAHVLQEIDAGHIMMIKKGE